MGVRLRENADDDSAVVFTGLIERHLDAAYRLATFILAGDQADAEDAVHDAGLRAWEHFGSLRDRTRFEQWFTRIVVNCCRDRLGARRLRPVAISDSVASSAPSHADAVIATDAFERALLTLSVDHRVVVALRSWVIGRSKRSPRAPASGLEP
jgi:RNA polymerase sigma factor (sigma-70 family)